MPQSQHSICRTIVRTRHLLASSVLCLAAGLSVYAAEPIPLELPRPDGKPGDQTKPVKVYVLAGQSNMVGMGDLSGARPEFAKIYYTADPAIIPGATPVGSNERGAPHDRIATARMGVHDATAGATPVALGTASATLPAINGSQSLEVTAQIEVPVSGSYFVRTGFGDSSYNTTTLDGKEVYRRDPGAKPVLTKVTLEAGKRYSINIKYLKSGSAAFWLEQVDMPGNGDLTIVTNRDRKFQYLLDDAGKWLARPDVIFKEARLKPEGPSTPLSPTSNGKAIGPEVGFGAVMGTFHDQQVLIIKTAQGNRSLGFDFRPPSSGRTEPDNNYEGFEYRAIIQGVKDTLAAIDKVVPGYQGQGYEIAGFGWFQGHKDSGATKQEYEKHLVNLINDVRKDLNAPNMKAVVATVGFHGYRISTLPWYGIWQAQMAVGDPKQHPEYSGNVASVDTRDFWREVAESPRNQDYHYNRNAETYMLIGEAMGRAMVRLEGGEAVAIPKSDREAATAARMADEAAATEPTDEQKAANRAAIQPFILESALASFVSEERRQTAIKAALAGAKPAKPTIFLDDVIDDAVQFYQAAGVHDFDWKPFAEDLRQAEWEYFVYDLPGRPGKMNVTNFAGAGDAGEGDDDTNAPQSAPKPPAKPAAAVPVKLTIPAGLEQWFAPDFDTTKAGFKTAAGPFGESAEHIVLPEWAQARVAKRVPKTVLDNDVLLMRKTLQVPPLEDGYRYRIRIAGSLHNNMGEGFAIYVDGQQLVQNEGGLFAWRRQGRSPRGANILPEHRELFKDGKVTLAVISFPMNNWDPSLFIPPGQPLSVWIEQQKLPPIGE